ncbi:hypothetical protein MMC07_002626 [Pseudocyphellaria aurata]|nr:hypothetical protein [Pseudocyphellaria aurata]
MQIHATEERAQAALTDTKAADALEFDYAAALDFGGMSTTTAQEGMRRASRGGQLSARQVHAVGGLLTGAARLQRIIQGAAKQTTRSASLLKPLMSAAKASCLAFKRAGAKHGWTEKGCTVAYVVVQ